MHILIIGGISRSLINFRGPLIKAMLANGHKVTTCAGTPLPEVEEKLQEWGVKFIPAPIARTGMNPLGDLRACWLLYRIMRQEKPDVVFAYTIKPVIWGSITARLARVPNIYALITGLGYAFMGEQTAPRLVHHSLGEGGRLKTEDQPETKHNSLNSFHSRLTQQSPPAAPSSALSASSVVPPTPDTRHPTPSPKQRLVSYLAQRLYKRSLKFSRKVFFQNPDDAHEFITRKLVDHRKTVVVSGSGIDLSHFPFLPSPRRSTAWSLSPQSAPATNNEAPSTKHQAPKTSFLLIARLLRDKGICEYAEAAAIIKREHPEAEFHLIGDYDPNPSGLKPEEVEAWVKAETIIYHGHQPDVRPLLQACSVYVLPSYREGTPRTVLEAMATGRPIITTDAPGCRETIRFLATSPEPNFENNSLHSPHSRLTQQTPPPPSAPSNPAIPHSPNPAILLGTNGILIPARDPEALAEAMRFFLDHPEQIASMGHASRQYAEDRYDVHKVNAVMLREMGL